MWDSKNRDDRLRELKDNMKHNNIQIIGMREGEEKDQGMEILFEKIMTENFPNLERGKATQVQGSAEGPNQDERKEAYSKTS